MSNPEKAAKVAEYSLEQVTRYLNQGNYFRAFPHYLVFAQLKKEIFLSQHSSKFIDITNALIKHLESHDPDKIGLVYEQAAEVLQNQPQFLTNYASFLLNNGQRKKAETLFKQALASDEKFLEARDKLDTLSSMMLDRWHYPMLNDVSRNTKYQDAIRGHVSRGCSCVMDIGTGTGLLALIAARAGAEKVFACEASEDMFNIADDVIRNNNGDSKVKLISKLSTDMTNEDVPEKVSLIVTETFDAGLLGEHVLESLHDARSRFLVDGGNVVPSSANFIIAPIQSSFISRYSVFEGDKAGYLDMNIRLQADFLLDDGTEEPYQSEKLSSLKQDVKLLAAPQQLFSVNFCDMNNIEEYLRGQHLTNNFSVTSDGRLDAIVGWFDLKLDENNIISNSIEDKSCWEQAIFPILQDKRKVYRSCSIIETKFLIKKHVALEEVTINNHIEGNGVNGVVETKEAMLVNSSAIQQLNSDKRGNISQWVAYYAAQDGHLLSILDMTLKFPDIGLQILKLKPDTNLTLMIDAADTRGSSQLLNLVTRVAGDNSINPSRIDCATQQTDDSYNLVFICPVSSSGRLNTECLLELDSIKLQPMSTLLPHCVEVWCEIVSCGQLDTMVSLVNDDNVAGFRISEHINKLSVFHQQDLFYAGLDLQALCDPLHVTTLNLTNLNLERQEVSISVPITKSGAANCIVYWFIMDYGWNIKENSRESDQFKQAAFVFPAKKLEEGNLFEVICQTENGLMELRVGEISEDAVYDY